MSLDRQIGTAIQELVAHPGECERIASEIASYLCDAESRPMFIKLVSDTFDTCVSYGTNIMPLFTKLFLRLDQSAFITAESKTMKFSHALDSCLQRTMPLSPIALYTFRRKMPFMNEVFRLGILRWSLLKSLNNFYARIGDNEIAIRYQLEIVRNVSMLIDNGTIPSDKIDDSYWRQCVARIKSAIESNLIQDRNVIADASNFVTYINQKRNNWKMPFHSSKLEDARSLLSRQNSNAVASAPSNSNLVTIVCSGDEEPPPSVVTMKKTIINDQPPTLKLTIPTEIPVPAGNNSSAEVASGNVALHVDRPLPPPIQLIIPPPLELPTATPPVASSLLLPVHQSAETLMENFLNSKSNDIHVLVESIKQVFSSRLTDQQLLEDVKDILKVTFASIRDFPVFAKCIGVIERLQSFDISPGTGNGLSTTVSFRDLISRCAVDTKPVVTKEDVIDFCTSFRLTNELYRIGAVRRDVYQVYALRMTNTDCEAAYVLLFEIMKNLDSLVDAEIAQLTEAEINFWTASNARLVHALRTKRRFFDIQFVRNVTSFLVGLSQKGNWSRKKQHQQQQQPDQQPQLPAPPPPCESGSDVVLVKEEPCESCQPRKPVPTEGQETEKNEVPPRTSSSPPPPLDSVTTQVEASSSSIIESHVAVDDQTVVSNVESVVQAEKHSPPSKESEMVVEERKSEEAESNDKDVVVTETRSISAPQSQPRPEREAPETAEEPQLVPPVPAEPVQVETCCEEQNKKTESAPSPMSVSSDEEELPPQPTEKTNEVEQEKTSNDIPPKSPVRTEEIVVEPIAVVPTPSKTKPSTAPSSSLQFHPVDGDIRALTKSLTLVSRGVEPLKAKLKSIGSLFTFTSALELLLPKIFEQIVDEKSFKDAVDLCLDLWREDYGRGKNFPVEFEQFCLKYVSGKNTLDFERLKQVLREKRSSAEVVEEQGESSSLVEEKLQVYEKLYSKRRLGCTRVIGRFFALKNVNLKFLMLFCDALLGTRSEHSLECLKQLLVDIGEHFAVRVRDSGYEDWWTGFYDELLCLGLNAESSESLKRIVREIVLLKSHWPEVDSRRLAREKLTELLSSLTPDLLDRARDDYNAVLDQIGNLVIQEFPERYAQQFIEVFINKINQTLADATHRSERPASVIDLTSSHGEISPAASPSRTVVNADKDALPSATPTPEAPASARKRSVAESCVVVEQRSSDDEPVAKR